MTVKEMIMLLCQFSDDTELRIKAKDKDGATTYPLFAGLKDSLDGGINLEVLCTRISFMYDDEEI